MNLHLLTGGGSDCTGGSADLLPLSTFTLWVWLLLHTSMDSPILPDMCTSTHVYSPLLLHSRAYELNEMAMPGSKRCSWFCLYRCFNSRSTSLFVGSCVFNPRLFNALSAISGATPYYLRSTIANISLFVQPCVFTPISLLVFDPSFGVQCCGFGRIWVDWCWISPLPEWIKLPTTVPHPGLSYILTLVYASHSPNLNLHHLSRGIWLY